MRMLLFATLPFFLICIGTSYALDYLSDRTQPTTIQETHGERRFRPITHHLPDVQNIRDCGGWKTQSGRHVRTGRIYRTAELNNVNPDRPHRNFVLSEESRSFFRDSLKIRTDIDLRNDKECTGMTASPLGPDITWVHIPSMAYSKIGLTEGKVAFKKVFQTLLQEKNYPAIIHCRQGRDRAGTAIYLINALLGVPEQDLRHDWELTERLKRNARFDYGKISGVESALHQYPGTTINEKVQAFVLSLGFTQDDIMHFRTLMLEPDTVQ